MSFGIALNVVQRGIQLVFVKNNERDDSMAPSVSWDGHWGWEQAVVCSHHKPHHDVDFVKMWDVNSTKVNSQRTDTNYVNRTPNVNITSIKRCKGERGKCRVYISEDSIYEII